MRWVAPTEKDEANQVLEKRLWDAADQFRANEEQYLAKCNVLFEHVYEAYLGEGKSVYSASA